MLCLAPVHLALLRRACSAFSRKSQIVQPARLGAILYLKQRHWSAASWKPATETGHQASCLPFHWPGTWTANSPVSSPQLEFRQGTQMETAGSGMVFPTWRGQYVSKRPRLPEIILRWFWHRKCRKKGTKWKMKQNLFLYSTHLPCSPISNNTSFFQ